MTQLLRGLQQKGAVGRLAAFRVYRRAKKALDALHATLGKYAFNRDAQRALYGGWRSMECLRACLVELA